MKKFGLALVCFLYSFLVTAQQQQEIVYVDIDYVLSRLPDMKELEEKITVSRQRLEGEYTAKNKLLQEHLSSYNANVTSMHDTVRMATEKNLQQLRQEIQQFPQHYQSTLENTRKLYMAPIYLKVGSAIQAVASENNLAVVLPVAIGGMEFLLYADPRRNISDVVLQALGVDLSEAGKK